VRSLYNLPPKEIPENQSLITFVWKLNISSTKLPSPEIKFRILPKELPFTKAAQQPESGSLGLTWDELHPAQMTDSSSTPDEKTEEASASETNTAEDASAENNAQ